MTKNVGFPVIIFWRQVDGGLRTEVIPQLSINSNISDQVFSIIALTLNQFNIPIDPATRFEAFWLDTDFWISNLSENANPDWNNRPLIVVDQHLKEYGPEFFKTLIYSVPQYKEFVAMTKVRIDKRTNQTTVHPLKIFLCHSSIDKPTVRSLYNQLRSEGFNPWLDEEKLLPGQDWRQEISKAVRAADIVIVCLSRSSVSKAGYAQKEITYALDIADEQPEGRIFLIPLKLEECEVPSRLSRWQWVNYFDKNGFKKLTDALTVRSALI